MANDFIKEPNPEQVMQIIDNPAFAETIQKAKWELFTRWTVADTVNERESIHSELRGLLILQAKFEGIVQDAMYDATQKSRQETD